MIYLDNSATTYKKPKEVWRASKSFRGNPGRGGHHISIKAAETVYECRERLCSLFNAPTPERMIFTSNATDSLNLAIFGAAKEGGHIVISSMEHNSVVRPVMCGKFSYTVVKADKQGFINPDSVKEAIRSDTCLVAVTHASNVCGSIQPIAEIAAVAHAAGVPLLVDGAQSAGVIPIDIPGLNIDFFGT